MDKTLDWQHDMAPEVDEIIPLSKGGNPLAWDNVQLAHRLCNRTKGNATAAALDPPRTSRNW